MKRLLAWVGLAALAAYVIFLAGAGPGTIYADRRLATLASAALLLAVWAALARRHAELRARSVLWPAIVVGLTSLGVSTLFSRYPRVSAEYLGFAIVLAALYLLLVRLLATRFFQIRIVALSGMLFFVIGIGYVAIVVSHWISWWGVVGTVVVPPLRPDFESLSFGNPSHVLMIETLLAIPTAAAIPWTTARGRVRLVVVIVLTGIVALLTGSRAGWLAVALAGVVGLITGTFIYRTGIRGWLLGSATRVRFLMGAVIATLLVPAALLAPAILRRVSEGGEDLRLTYVAVAIRLFAESPIVGTGLGTWVVQRIAYTTAPETDYYIPHAHNLYAQTLAEQGIVGLVAGLFAVGALTWLVRGAIRADEHRRQWGLALFIGLIYFACHEALDFNVNLPTVLLALAIPIAYLDATSNRHLPLPRLDMLRVGRWTRVAAPTAYLAVGLSITGLAWQELPALSNDRAIAAANEGDWLGALAPARGASATDPEITSFLFTAALAEAHAGNHDGAAALFAAVAERDDLPEAWLNLAAEDEARGNRSTVATSLQKALRLGYQRPAVAMPVGDLALRVGEQAIALDAFTNAVLMSPSLAADEWWQREPARAAMLERVVENAIQAAPGKAWEVALMSGDSDLALAQAPDDTTRLFVQAWAGGSTARRELSSQCRSDPLNIDRLLLCSRAARRAGELADASDFQYLAEAQIGGAYAAATELRVATRPLIGRSSEGNLALFWGTFTYRRPTPWDMLVPSLVHLTVT